jgi:hypothetical protein
MHLLPAYPLPTWVRSYSTHSPPQGIVLAYSNTRGHVRWAYCNQSQHHGLPAGKYFARLMQLQLELPKASTLVSASARP